GLLGRPFNAEDREAVGRLLHIVEDVVERRGQRVDVFAVEGRDEALIEGADDPAYDLVAGVFFELEVVAAGDEPVKLGHHVEKLARRSADNSGGLVEHVEELQLPRNQAETHRRSPGGTRAWPRINGFFMEWLRLLLIGT